MQSNADTLGQYLDEAPAGRRDTLAALRASCTEPLDGFEESMAYSDAVVLPRRPSATARRNR